jgi:malate synthase
MEDAATAEISRSQIWQWIRHPKGSLSDGRKVSVELFRTMLSEEVEKIKVMVGAENFANGQYKTASDLIDQISTSDDFVDFLTLPGYRLLA